MELQGKVAIVTGASRGIGAQIAEELAKRGANLFLTWTPTPAGEERATKVIEKIKSLQPNATIHGTAVDLSLPESPAKVIEAFLKHWSKIDILINNAGTDLLGSIADTTLEDYNRVMDLNLRAPFFVTQAAHPHLRAPARIINISSIAARSGFPIGCVYSMTKAGLEGMTRSMAKAYGGDGTTVNAVAPGVVETDMLGKWDKEWIQEDAAMTPVQRRTGQPDDVAQVVAFLAGEGSRWVSGQTISACGGVVMI
ncbi:hypothetical protein PRZ48_011735 [Zasmidium cellare]|uniref:Uncharacterized protein n=1 Tax=Zasmidium cellare TaxID=395010 RepID=A0ABR0E772_ZASCE|nr:hypothetical protein PRZ48_011735 [Zasmidium cellare]